MPKPSKKKQNPLSSLIFGKKTQNSGKGPKLSAVGAVEELFEEGSAMLAERYVCHRNTSKDNVSTLKITRGQDLNLSLVLYCLAVGISATSVFRFTFQFSLADMPDQIE